jgi:hypothetical protein
MANYRSNNSIMNQLKSFVCMILFGGLTLLHLPCSAQTENTYTESFSVKVSNPLDAERTGVMIYIPADGISKKFNPNAFAVFEDKAEIPSQYNYNDKDYHGIVFVLDKVKAKEVKTFTVRYAKAGEVKHQYLKRTQAELSHKINGEWKDREYVGGTFKNVEYLKVPREHKDHSWFIRYEGPGWESDQVGYRLYLDQRNAVDVFGKRVPEPVLQKAGLDGFDSYHELQEWGMDILKVAKSLGVGSIGTHTNTGAVRVEKTDSVTCRITENSDVYSSFLTRYLGWNPGTTKVDLDSRISIHAGTRITHNRINIKGAIDNICTGVIKDDKAKPKLLTKKGDGSSYGYLATYGAQSLNNNDNLGIVVFFRPSDMIEFTQDEFSHIVKLKPSSGKIDYYYAGVWQLEPNGIKDEAGFVAYIEKTAKELASPVKVEILK